MAARGNNLNLYNAKQICETLSICKRKFARMIPLLVEYKMFKIGNTWHIRESNLRLFIDTHESGFAQKYKEEENLSDKTPAEGSAG